MEPAIKKVVAALATALIVVIGVILWTGSAKTNAAVTTDSKINSQNIEENRQTEPDGKPDAQEKPLDGAQAGEAGAASEAQPDDGAQKEDLYEGALAGLSDEEIAKMAMAEEESAARTEMTGAEDAVD